MTTLRLLSTVAALALAVTACAGETKVGDDSLLDFEEQDADRAGIEDAAPTSTATPSAAPSTAPPAQPTVAPTTAAPQPKIALEVSINSDTADTSQFDPSIARIYQGTCVRFTNRDAVARSVVADSGAFSSGPIAPGASWVHCAETPGTFNYHDGTRPYAVASLEVIAR